jgi:DNA-binding FadR family transcriptional regulator
MALLEDVTGPPTDNGRLAHEDAAFHEALAQATGNRSLYEHLRLIDERLYFTRLHDITTAERLQITCQQHLRILACIRNGDVQAAQQAMRVNIEFGRSNVDQALKEALARAFLGNHTLMGS